MAVYLGNTYMGSAYLGNTPIVTAAMKSPSSLQFRNDPYSASLVLAMPYCKFDTLGMTNFYDDVSANIKGVGSNYNLVPTGSGVFSSSGQVMSSGSYDWTSDGYTTSAEMSGSYNAGVINTAVASFQGNPFVIETWIKFTGDIYPVIAPPFNQFVFGETSGDYLLADFTGGGGGWRFVSSGPPSGGWSFTSTTAYTKNVWYSIVYVRSVGATQTESIYLNGNRIATQTQGTVKIIPDAPEGYWNILGTNGINDSGAHQTLDFRLYIGTDKGYTGSTITVPQSIVTIA